MAKASKWRQNVVDLGWELAGWEYAAELVGFAGDYVAKVVGIDTYKMFYRQPLVDKQLPLGIFFFEANPVGTFPYGELVEPDN